jgi:dihydroorotase
MTRSPASAEAQARLIRFAGLTGARLHIAHISYNAIGALDDLRAARAAGSRTTTEVAPPCLSFADLERVGVLGIPFAHSDEDNQRYWEALGDGTIDAVATDHAPHTREEKLRGAENAWLAASGYPGVETMMPLMLDGAFSGRITLERLVEVTAANPARICGLPRKGAIAIGRDADLILVDPAGIWEIDEARMHSKAGWSPYHGRRLKGRIRHVFLRGTEIARDGELLDAPKMGQHMAVTPAQ